MSLDKIAKILHVDEVKLMHGPKGVAVYVRIAKSWHISTIDNDELEERGRKQAITEQLVHLADANMHKIRDIMQKGSVEVATRAAMAADAAAAAAAVQRRRFGLSWDDVGGFDRPRDGAVQQQVQRAVDPVPARVVEPPTEPAAVIEQMPSRFHAIMAELGDL